MNTTPETHANAPHPWGSVEGYAPVSAPEHWDAVQRELDSFLTCLAAGVAIAAECAAEVPGSSEDVLFGRLAARAMHGVKWNIPAEYGEEAGALIVRDVFGLFVAKHYPDGGASRRS
jgi:hypothetical protein